VVLGRDDVFADSLAGTALAGATGPVLYTDGGADGALRAETQAEIARVLPAGGTVNILGGTAAVSTATEDALRALGYQVRRFSGSTRVETAVAIAMAVDSTPQRVLLARSDSWADAVTGGAWAAEAGLPILITPPDALHPAAAAALQTLGNPEVVLLGGEAALSSRVATEAQAQLRISGSSRAGTAAEIARRLWGRTTAAATDHFLVVEGWQADSWAPALAGAVLSARWDAPQVLLDGTTAEVPAETASYLAELSYDSGLRAVATLVGPELGQAHLEAMRGLLGG
jgi:putative cell wall-binding protein